MWSTDKSEGMRSAWIITMSIVLHFLGDSYRILGVSSTPYIGMVDGTLAPQIAAVI